MNHSREEKLNFGTEWNGSEQIDMIETVLCAACQIFYSKLRGRQQHMRTDTQ